jgi:hypothetical protein
MQFNQPLTVLLLVLFVALCATAHADILREDYSLPAYQHQFIPAEKVSFNVPENRASSNSRNLTLGYVRLQVVPQPKPLPIHVLFYFKAYVNTPMLFYLINGAPGFQMKWTIVLLTQPQYSCSH